MNYISYINYIKMMNEYPICLYEDVCTLDKAAGKCPICPAKYSDAARIIAKKEKDNEREANKISGQTSK